MWRWRPTYRTYSTFLWYDFNNAIFVINLPCETALHHIIALFVFIAALVVCLALLFFSLCPSALASAPFGFWRRSDVLTRWDDRLSKERSSRHVHQGNRQWRRGVRGR